jgi:hypothetical protein
MALATIQIPVSPVRGTNGGSRYAVPLRIKPERGQVSENSVKPPSKECCDVLHDDEAGSKLANQTGVFTPETRALAVNSGARPGDADVLAGEAPADGIDGNSVCRQTLGREGPHVVVTGDAGPMLGEDGAAIGLDLAERDRLKAPGSFEPKRKSSNAGKEVEDPHALTFVGLK